MRVFVLDQNGIPLTSTTPCRARRLLQDNVAKKVWSKFNTFGIQMLISVGNKTPLGTLGVDNGTKFEGYSVVVGDENLLNIKMDLPDKQKIVNKLTERREARRARRGRLRRRECRPDNRNREDFIAPSQRVLVQARLNMIKDICSIYPIHRIGIEDVCFNHARYKWGKNFSTVEIGKNKIRTYIKSIAELFEFKGYETKEIRERLGYKKISDKSKNCFESHCCDSLAIASEIIGKRINPLRDIIVVDKTYIPVRRRLYKSNFLKGGIRENGSRGTVKSIQKGRKVGYKGRSYILSGTCNGKYRLTQIIKREKRTLINSIQYISTQYIIM